MSVKTNTFKKAHFPIERDIVVSNHTCRKSIKRGDTVKCIFCGELFVVNSKTAFMFDDMEYITCPECTRKVDACYYMGKVFREAPKNYAEEDGEI